MEMRTLNIKRKSTFNSRRKRRSLITTLEVKKYSSQTTLDLMLPSFSFPQPVIDDVEIWTVLMGNSLLSGDHAIIALALISALITIPIAEYYYHYADTVGYGLSVVLQGYLLYLTFRPSLSSVEGLMTVTTIVWGLRLAGYLELRYLSGYNPYRKDDTLNRFFSLLYGLVMSFFFALLICPVLNLLRNPPEDAVSLRVAWTGLYLSWTGLLLEAIADFHKFSVKLTHKDRSKFYGPIAGVYRLCRHPNYTGELIFWFGVWLAGLPSSPRESVRGWLSSTPGLIGIIAVLLVATRRTERKQERKYHGQPHYELWKKRVPSPLVPGVK